MTDYEKSVMRNIIYAVETGGRSMEIKITQTLPKLIQILILNMLLLLEPVSGMR